MPRKEVVRVLNEENVPTAAVYKQRKGCTRDWFPDGKKGGWNIFMVAKIIRDERYAGHMVGHRKVYESFDSKLQVTVDRSEWIVVRNTHEWIVTQEEFDRANANMRSVVQGKKKNPANKGNFSVIVCPHCGLTLRPGKNTDSFMYCPTGRMHRDSPCGSVRIRRNVAERALMELVCKQAELLVSAEQLLKEKRKQRAGKQGMNAGDVKAEMKRQELTAVLGEMEAQEIVEEDSGREYGKALGIKEYLHLEEYDKAVMASLIASAKVMGVDRLEVTWKHQDVYKKILGEMQG